MAEVSYKHEPTVTVHGIPKSQYDTQSPVGGAPVGGPPPTGIMSDIKMHPIWAISIGIGVIAIAIMVYLWWVNNSNGTSTTSTSGAVDPNTGVPYASEQAGQYGSQLDADYQQMMSFQNQMIGILQQIQTGQTGTTGTGTGGTTTTPTYNIANGLTSSGVLGGPASVFQNGGVWSFETSGMTSPEALSDILPSGTKIYQGNQGRWWFELPGSNEQYLLTPGSTPSGGISTGGLGAFLNPPKGAITITKPSLPVSPILGKPLPSPTNGLHPNT